MKKLRIIELNTMDYAGTIEIMQDVSNEVAGGADDALIFVEYNPVITVGADGRENSVVDSGYLRGQGIPVVRVDRGGAAVVHNNGQLVGYPVMKVPGRPLDMLADIVDVIAEVLSEFGVQSEKRDEPGLWVSGRKIGFVGMKIHRGVSTHGFAINVSNNLDLFQTIETCGIRDARVTNLMLSAKKMIPMDKIKSVLISRFSRRFHYIPDAFIIKDDGFHDKTRMD